METVENLAPYDPRLYILKAQVLLKQGEYTAALENAQKAYNLDQTQLPVYLALAQASLFNDKPKEAQNLIETYLLYEDKDPQAWLVLGLSAFQNGDRETAFKAMDKALELDQRLPEAYRYRGLLYLEMGEGQNAVNDLVEAVRFSPKDFEINWSWDERSLRPALHGCLPTIELQRRFCRNRCPAAPKYSTGAAATLEAGANPAAELD